LNILFITWVSVVEYGMHFSRNQVHYSVMLRGQNVVRQ